LLAANPEEPVERQRINMWLEAGVGKAKPARSTLTGPALERHIE
jgi:hypothetical protein